MAIRTKSQLKQLFVRGLPDEQTRWTHLIDSMLVFSGDDLSLTGNLALVHTTSSTTGVVTKGGDRFIHNFALAGTTGNNTFVGDRAGNFTMTGATGSEASALVGIGRNALAANTTGYNNVAIGVGALAANTTGFKNIAIGHNACNDIITGNENTVIGFNALPVSTDGDNNVAIGSGALLNTLTDNNIAIGYYTAENYNGGHPLTSPTTSIFIGNQIQAATNTDDNAVVIGYGAVGELNSSGTGSNVVTLGNNDIVRTYLKGNVCKSVESSITASTTQAQGQQPLTKDINEISVCANANDVVTLPDAKAGLEIFIRNNGANILQIFPASGDDLGLGVDASITLGSGASTTFVSYNSTDWR